MRKSTPLFCALLLSLSARRAWIEIIDYVIDYVNDAVALRKESVDRNTSCLFVLPGAGVALRKESVDRNTQRRDFKSLGLLSLSARRAWIEMALLDLVPLSDPVALRKESVDRNHRLCY